MELAIILTEAFTLTFTTINVLIRPKGKYP